MPEDKHVPKSTIMPEYFVFIQRALCKGLLKMKQEKISYKSLGGKVKIGYF